LSLPHHFIIHTLFTQTLTTLNLWGNKIGPQGAQHLANALQINKVTTTLLLFLLLITSSFTLSTQTLTTLNLDSNQIGDDGRKRVMDIIRKNSIVKVSF
jgi:hypothetical protein